MYTWVPTHKAIAQKLLDYEHRQKELIQILRNAGETILNDRDKDDNVVDLEEIDPFTFFCYIYKYGPEKQLERLRYIANHFDIKPLPYDQNGNPSANAQKVWLFPYKKDRVNNEVSRLWRFFKAAMNESIDNELFADILKIKGAGSAKLTEGLFYINPEKYLPIDAQTKPYLKEMHGINPLFTTWTEFNKILNNVREKTDDTFYKISHEAWMWNTSRRDINYWVFKGDPKLFDIIGSLKDNALSAWKVSAHKERIKIGDKVIIWVTGEKSGCYALCKVLSEVYYKEESEEEKKYYIDKTKIEGFDRVDIEVEHNFWDRPVLREQVVMLPEFENFKADARGTNFSSNEDEYNLLLSFSKEGEPFLGLEYLQKFRKEDLDEYFSFLRQIINHFNLKKGDKRLVFTLQKASVNLTIGQRYALNLFRKTLREKRFGVLSLFALSNESEPFSGNSPKPFYTKVNELKFKGSELKNIYDGIKIELERSDISGFLRHNNSALEDYVFENFEEKKSNMSYPLNQILYGPPGTGKTFKTINKAIEIIISDFSSTEVLSYRSSNGTEKSIEVSALYGILISDDESKEKREVLTNIFKKFRDEGKIEFVTFHQSFSYEDFVEGIRPVLPDEDGTIDIEEEENLIGNKSESIRYRLKEGIFKRISLKARGVQGTVKETKDVSFDNVNFYKMSLGGKLKPHIHKWCIENKKVSIGWGRDHDFKNFLDIKNNWDLFSKKFKTDLKELVDDSSYHIQAMYTFLNMKKGDIMVASKGNKVIDAVGVISSDKYHFETEEGIHYKQFRDIEWLAIDMNASPEIFFKKNISQQTIYQFYDDDVKKDEFKKLLQKDKGKIGNYVLIIDEINRGNVASIFGELITLIEQDKRLGAANELSLRLPYSNENDEAFGVPANLYIIGTMNTADRSIEALDTALRRRFSFEFMEPKPELVPELEEYGINLREIFIAINKRITYLLDGDHRIGHSYFMGIKDEEGLKCAFKDKIIPLLKEYFFNDYGKILLVLGEGFVREIEKPEFAVKSNDELDNTLYEIMPIDNNFQIIEAIKKTT